ncbi:alpha-(1-_3)-arabinofuranosyltransferase [Actinokineospora sp. HUAS TT18]|uniref:alpha-(1->3)-arabinofuranosyltransferase n=1 Tax=Actinokineospora sp. HUAS TT18 TaxID=3447451 RepID=UPI003F528208
MSTAEPATVRAPGRVRAWLAGLPRNLTAWVMAGLVLLSFLQRPGRTTFDTKLDLAVDPIAFLGRALHLWNPAATGGELQNQAYGYLFPMGPYFGFCQLVGLPPWVAQRLWCGLLLCLAFGGVLAVARALRIGTEPARYAAALAYALAPRMLTEIGPLSAEMLAAVMLPWVLLPLIRVDKIGSPRRAAALSALAIVCMGGVNGAVVILALVLPGLWLLTRTWTRAHVRLVLWWGAGALAAVLWWFLPLALLGEYSLPFVDYVESATNTTTPTSLFQVLRGTNQWVAYVVQGTPWWPSGFMLIDNPVLMLATGVLAAIGLLGLVRSRLPERLFLTLGVVAGVTFLTIGYVGTLDSPFSEPVRALLDGPLAPLRNVHKFEPGLRLPLVLAFAHAISGRLPGLTRKASSLWATRARLAVGFLLVTITAAPAWLFTLRPGPGWDEVPDYWRSAMTWVADADADARTLLIPGTGFGEYTWGKTIDEPAQSLARSPWALRSQIPLGSEGNTRLMDAVEDALADGRGAPGLADFLARSGHRFLLLRNDIDRSTTGAPPRSVLRAALARSPGIERVTGFGPELDGGDGIDKQAPKAQAIEIYEVKRTVPRAVAVPTADVATVSGGPESLLPLLDSGLLAPTRPTVLAGDGGAPDARDWLVTDGLRYRERNVGRVRDNLSQTLTAEEKARQNRPAIDLVPFEGIQHRTLATYRGIRAVTASSAASFADAVRGSDPSTMPFAAIDGDPYTAWQSSSLRGPAGQWFEVELDTPRVVDHVTLRVVDDPRLGWPVTRVRITTDKGSVERDVERGNDAQVFTVTPGLTSTIRVTFLSVAADRDTGNVGIAELTFPGLEAERALRVPADVTPGVDQHTSFAFTRGALPSFSCLREISLTRCDAGLTRFGEEPTGIHRLFRTSLDKNYEVAGTVLPVAGAKAPLQVPGLEVSATSQLAGDPAAGPLAAIDADPGTTWIADYTDQRPILKLRWGKPSDITGLKLVTDKDSGAGAPAEVEIESFAGKVRLPVFTDGSVDYRGTTDWMNITITRTHAVDGDPVLAPGITGLTLLGAPDALPRIDGSTRFTVPCGSGPKLRIDQFDYATKVTGTLSDLNNHRALPLGICPDLAEGVDLPSGEHEIRTDRSDAFLIQDLWLRPSDASAGTVGSRAVDVRTWEVSSRELTVAAGPRSVLAVPENANDGWVATVDGQPLERTRVDGWQQAWILPAGGEVDVSLEFAPDTSYRVRLLIGLIAVLGLVVLAFAPARRTQVSTEPGGEKWVPIALIVLLGAMGGMLAIVLLIACLLLRSLMPRYRRAISMTLAALGMTVATATAVIGRVLDHGQEWAYGATAQAAIIVALAAVVAARIPWFDKDPSPATHHTATATANPTDA